MSPCPSAHVILSSMKRKGKHAGDPTTSQAWRQSGKRGHTDHPGVHTCRDRHGHMQPIFAFWRHIEILSLSPFQPSKKAEPYQEEIFLRKDPPLLYFIFIQ